MLIHNACGSKLANVDGILEMRFLAGSHCENGQVTHL